jgi:hypothetical protein
MARVVVYEQILYVWRTHTLTCVRDAMFTEKAPLFFLTWRIDTVCIHTGINGLDMGLGGPKVGKKSQI